MPLLGEEENEGQTLGDLLELHENRNHGGTGRPVPSMKAEDEAFRDDLTGQLLNPELVKKARKKELEYFTSKGVW